jgi:hypothetical protein
VGGWRLNEAAKKKEGKEKTALLALELPVDLELTSDL